MKFGLGIVVSVCVFFGNSYYCGFWLCSEQGYWLFIIVEDLIYWGKDWGEI